MNLNPNHNGGGGGGGGGGSPCGACKFLRRKCVATCVFAPYFDAEQGSTHFAAVHKVFGASNVAKLLAGTPVHRRLDTVITVCYEAQSRLKDPIYGCVSQIFALQQQVVNLQAEIAYLQGQFAQLEIPHQPAPPPPPHGVVAPPAFAVADPPAAPAAAMPAAYDLPPAVDPMVHPNAWAMQQRAIDPRQYVANAPSTSAPGGHQAMGRGVLRRHGSTSAHPASSSNAP
ncbi:LOB domain-containing protein 18 [Abrus precatorius]|uniref:LOB domain-containing protein 18 n=1 Tax=Abrus precatorius TaxID=3816 RepID=A0A8B8K3V4_ABRPR|nr:LOB domain-containing protein 18 [Abrus precatorius]